MIFYKVNRSKGLRFHFLEPTWPGVGRPGVKP